MMAKNIWKKKRNAQAHTFKFQVICVCTTCMSSRAQLIQLHRCMWVANSRAHNVALSTRKWITINKLKPEMTFKQSVSDWRRREWRRRSTRNKQQRKKSVYERSIHNTAHTQPSERDRYSRFNKEHTWMGDGMKSECSKQQQQRRNNDNRTRNMILCLISFSVCFFLFLSF